MSLMGEVYKHLKNKQSNQKISTPRHKNPKPSPKEIKRRFATHAERVPSTKKRGQPTAKERYATDESKEVKPKRRGRLQRGLGEKSASTRYPTKQQKSLMKGAAGPPKDPVAQSNKALSSSRRQIGLNRIAEVERRAADKAVSSTRQATDRVGSATNRAGNIAKGVGRGVKGFSVLSILLDLPQHYRTFKALQKKKKNMEKYGRPEGGLL